MVSVPATISHNLSRHNQRIRRINNGHLIMSKRVFVGISGGVDSSVSAFLLKEAGFTVEGVFMKNWESDEADTHCPIETDLQDATIICEQLNIPLRVINFADNYWQFVFAHFLSEYQAGRTPNPDILCNREIKFKAFLEYAKTQGADCIATGHYARIEKKIDSVKLLKGIDVTKDQSYFLHALSQSQLKDALFPVGELEKKKVREIAKSLLLKTHDKKDSTGICFIGERKFKQFLSQYLPATPGIIETESGEAIGKHDGLMYYTIGQRQGLQIGGIKGKSEEPWYVAHKDLTRNVLIVIQGEHPLLYRQTLMAKEVNWITAPNTFPCTLSAKTRYRQTDQACTVNKVSDDAYEVTFAEPQRAITPGQSVVFYEHDCCLGGGIII